MPNHCDDSYMYLNYYTAEVNDEIDNPPIGLFYVLIKVSGKH